MGTIRYCGNVSGTLAGVQILSGHLYGVDVLQEHFTCILTYNPSGCTLFVNGAPCELSDPLKTYENTRAIGDILIERGRSTQPRRTRPEWYTIARKLAAAISEAETLYNKATGGAGSMRPIQIHRDRCNPPERSEQCDNCAGALECFGNQWSEHQTESNSADTERQEARKI